MKEYYSEYRDRSSERRRTGWTMRLVDLAATIVSAVVAAAMAVTFFVPALNPARAWFLPVLGLVAPAVYVATVVAALYWIIRWRWIRASAMLVLVIIGLFRVSLFYRPEFRRVYDEQQLSEKGSFKVMTYNVRGLWGPSGKDSADSILRLIGAENPDIVCLQEFNPHRAQLSDEYAWLEEQYISPLFGRTLPSDSTYTAPMVILSKYPVLRSGWISSPQTLVWADVTIGDDTVRIIDCHLRSTAIKPADEEYIASRRFLSDTASESMMRSIVGRFRENCVLRAAQVDDILAETASVRGPRIVCGDFNDTPVSYVYARMSDGLKDAFRECGSGYSHTFRGFYNTLRIDYVLSSDRFETLTYEVPEVDYSDHLPVVVRLRKRTKNH